MIVEANVWISALHSKEPHHLASRQWFRRQLAARADFFIPTLALPEIAGSIARRDGRAAAGHRAVRWILRTPNLQIVPLHQERGLRAAEIAADYQLRGADAVYVAIADELGLPLVTLDQELQARAAAIVNVIQP